ncbi:MAG: tetratricopeptide repeat protein [Bacteroidota bacterium]|nr:tetratricopeptide repeat protein [Bacteroidota bacterium]
MQKTSSATFFIYFLLTAYLVSPGGIAFAQTQNKQDSVRKEMQRNPRDIRTVGLFFEGLRKTNRDSASAFVTNMLIKAEDKQDTIFIALAYNFKASLMTDAKKSNEAITFYKKAIQCSKSRRDSAGVAIHANANRNLGFTIGNLGKYNDAEPYMEEALRLYSSIHDSTGLASVYVVYGQIEKDRGNYDRALSLLFTGLEIAEKKKDDKNIARMMNNIANVYVGQDKLDDAITFYEKSLAYKKKLGLKEEIGNTYGNIGVVYFEKKNYVKALEYYRLALPMKVLANDRRGMASTNNNMGLVFMAQNLMDSAELYVLKSLAIRLEINDETGIASSQTSLSDIYNKTDRCQKAVPLALNAIELARKNGAKEILVRAYGAASNAYRCLGNFKACADYLQLYVGMHDTLLQEASMKQAEEMKEKYESVKQEQRIKDLQMESNATKLKNAADEARAEQKQYIVWAGAIIALLLILFLFIRQRENQKSKLVLQKAYNEIETQNKNITDSIRYAQRIQQSILPDAENFNALFPESFIFYKPKDIVSGDFWWIHKTPEGQSVIAVADCTGHGVPGAFMSVMGADILSQMTNNKNINTPDEALHFLDEGVRQQLRQTGGDDQSRDGMDIALGLFDFKAEEVQFAGALRPLLTVRDGKLHEYPAARFSIGGAFSGKKNFMNHTIKVQKGDMLYLFTDGYSDQFGGPKGKKFKTAQLKELFVSIAALPADEQYAKLDEQFAKWKGSLEQVDDICVAGIKI